MKIREIIRKLKKAGFHRFKGERSYFIQKDKGIHHARGEIHIREAILFIGGIDKLIKYVERDTEQKLKQQIRKEEERDDGMGIRKRI